MVLGKEYSKHRMEEDCRVNDETVAVEGTLIFIRWGAYDAPAAHYIAKNPHTGRYSIGYSMPNPSPVTDSLTDRKYTKEEALDQLRKNLEKLRIEKKEEELKKKKEAITEKIGLFRR